MKLPDYLDSQNVSDARFAALVGTDRRTVWRWRKGSRPASRYIGAIVAATGGQVEANDFFNAAEHHEPPTTEAA
jgi:hypothetical protein